MLDSSFVKSFNEFTVSRGKLSRLNVVFQHGILIWRQQQQASSFLVTENWHLETFTPPLPPPQQITISLE